jgi:hypothetical protein
VHRTHELPGLLGSTRRQVLAAVVDFRKFAGRRRL